MATWPKLTGGPGLTRCRVVLMRGVPALSLSGKALIVNALALSRVWYVASLVRMPSWVRTELNRLVFKFLWSGKPDLVCCNVMFHPKEAGGFSVVSIDFKVSSLLVQWVRRLVVCPNSWVSCWSTGFLTDLEFLLLPFFLALHLFLLLLSLPSILPYFVPGWLLVVPCLLLVWLSVGLFVALFLSTPRPASLFTLSSQSLSLTLPCPTAFPSFSLLLVHCTGLLPGVLCFSSPLDRKVSDLNWKIAHEVLYTAQRLSSFCPSIPLACFCGF